jgi:23S rRNA pseudouridine1911/1915/1917 synthase
MKIVIQEEKGRLDQVLEQKTNDTRSHIQALIKEGNVLVNGNKEKRSYQVKMGDVIDFTEHYEETKAEPEKMDLDIVYEDNDVIVINKPSGMVVHPGSGNKSGTMVNGLAYHSKLSNINGDFRPGIVHRIDKDTSGLLMVAKNNDAHLYLAKQLEEHSSTREYIALVWGVINEDSGTIDAPIARDTHNPEKMCVKAGGKEAVTNFKVLERYKDATLVECQLETGRTHQIRVHFDYIKHPLVNDPVYGNRKLIDNTGQCLHAKTLGFVHPTTHKYMEFDSVLPEKMTRIIDLFKNEDMI